jgi:hypothetical protein
MFLEVLEDGIMQKQKLARSVHMRTSSFDPYRVVSDEEFCRNLNLIIAYGQMIKGETKKRFIGE